jgi:sortase A
MLAGVLLIILGGIIGYPFIQDALSPPPASFGEAAPLLRPTVTPLPRAGQAAILATPALLPETPLLTGGMMPPLAPTAQPVIVNQSAQVPTRLVIPVIDLDAPIEPVGWSQVDGVNTWDIPNHFAAGWLKTSAPLGRPGNTVLDGHHNTAGEVFRRLVDLKAGHLIEVYAGRELVFYEVTALHILPERDQPLAVRQRNAAWLRSTLDERLTLVTCWPPSTNTHRLIVIAKPLNAE